MPGHDHWHCRRRGLEATERLMCLACVLEAVPVAEEQTAFREADRCGIAACWMHDEPQASRRRWAA